MNMPSHWKPISGSASVISKITTRFTKLTDLVRLKRQNDTINEVLFYGSEDEEKKKELGLNNLFCIYYVIVHASQTIDVCVPSLISNTISKCLISAHQKNSTKIRIAVHSEDISIKPFLECGIQVKLITSGVKLEHEFVLIDAISDQDAIAIIGSLDYEVARVNCNRDSTLLTSETAVVLALKREFDRVWDSTEFVKEIKESKKSKTVIII